MRSIEKARAWEYFTQNRWRYLAAAGGAVGFMVLLYIGCQPSPSLKAIQDAGDRHGFYTLFHAVGLVCFGGAWLASQQDLNRKRIAMPFRLYALPVATWRLAFWQMTMGLEAAAGFSVLTGFSFWTLFAAVPPLVGPALFSVFAIAFLQALLWALVDLMFARLIVLIALPSLAFFFDVEAIFGGFFAPFASIGDASLILACVGTPIAYAVAIWGVDRERRGDAQGFPRLREFIDRFPRGPALFANRAKAYASPQSAHFWFEWGQKGYALPLAMAWFFLIVLFSHVAGWSDSSQTLDVLVGIAASGLLLAPLLGVMAGHTGATVHSVEMSVFRATRPLTDRALGWSIVRSCDVSCLAAWALCASVIGLTALWFHNAGDSEAVATSIGGLARAGENRYWTVLRLVIGPPLLGWALMSLGACLSLTGRAWPLLAAAAAFFGWWILLLIPLPFRTDSEVRLLGAPFHIAGIAMLLFSFSIGALAWRRRLIGALHVAGALALWLLLIGAAGHLNADYFNPAKWIFAPGVCALLASPIAFAPLAVYWNRHR